MCFVTNVFNMVSKPNKKGTQICAFLVSPLLIRVNFIKIVYVSNFPCPPVVTIHTKYTIQHQYHNSSIVPLFPTNDFQWAFFPVSVIV